MKTASAQARGAGMRGAWRQVGVLLLVFWTAAAVAQGYPERPVTLIVAFSAGGSSDPTMRALAEGASKLLGKRFVIENKPGGAGSLAASTVARAKPDGYTLSQIPQPVLRVPHMRSVDYDPNRDFTWIIGVADYTYGLVVKADAPWKTWKELVAHAKANPGRIRYATTGVGGTMHVAMSEVGSRDGLDWVNVVYKGISESTTALFAGDVDAVATSTGWGPLVNAGRLRILVAFGEQRMKKWPDVPTLRELGYDIVASSSYGVAGPKGMDPQIVKLLHDTFRRAMDEPDFLRTMDRLDQVTWYRSGEEYAKWVARTFEAEKRVVERLGLKP
jgi:tripartite-type tricarboxylate transporter receptor subunit TctC